MLITAMGIPVTNAIRLEATIKLGAASPLFLSVEAAEKSMAKPQAHQTASFGK